MREPAAPPSLALQLVECDRQVAHAFTGRMVEVDLLSPAISIHAFAELQGHLDKIDGCRLLLDDNEYLQSVFGGPEDITSRGKLQVRWQARLLANWLSQYSDVRLSSSRPSQSIIVVETDNIRRALLGTCALTTR